MALEERFPGTSGPRTQKAGVVKVQMGTITKELKPVVARFAEGFQQVHSN